MRDPETFYENNDTFCDLINEQLRDNVVFHVIIFFSTSWIKNDEEIGVSHAIGEVFSLVFTSG